MHGTPTLEYNLNIFFRTPELWSHHDKGKAALHFFADAQGHLAHAVQLDGRELWRLGLRGKDYFDNAASVDAARSSPARGQARAARGGIGRCAGWRAIWWRTDIA